ncbi:hypothetical protein KSS87_010230 [Heliosperma pusillum]|nr:hypothetical protein KSS87_010230 [Heliosperma pusillum]
MADLYGDWKGSYALLPRYLQALKTTNPGTVVKFAYKVGGPSNVRVFDRVFWAFGPSIRGFEHCRPILTVDGTHLYGKYKGVLLIAIGVDANDQIYPLAFAIVDCESIDTWGWFMDCIRKHVTQREGICVISDRHVGIMTAMSKVGGGWTEPQAFHRFCTRHQASNINTKFKSNELKLAFLSTACAAQRKRFNKGMQKIGSINPSAKMDPGPDDGTILHLQSTHRSQAIWEGEELKPLTLRGHMKAFKAFKVPEAVLTYVNNTQFRGITRFCYVPLDADLITALVERWRQETHTFHLPFGEATVTLQDVAMLFGLRISGRPVTGSTGPLLLLQLWSWERVSIGRPDIVRSRVPRQAGVAYPLGSQVLTGLDPLGCKWLRVQRGFKDHRLWLVVIRDLLDKMVELQFVWQPYTPSVVQHLSPICVQDQAEWTVIAPLICFEMVEWHFPNRCTRQFGWQQMIPEMGNTCTRLHGISRKGDWSGNYETMHQESIAKWENRMSNIVEPGLPFCGLTNFEDEYFEWYNAITRRIITPLSQTVNDDYEDHHYYYPTAADFQILTQTSMVTYNTTQEMISNMPDDIPLAQYAMIEKMRNMSLNSLVNTGQGHLINYQEPRPPSPPRYDFRHLAHRQQVMTQETEEAESSQRTRKKGKKRN